jgi:hypothetical protein
VDVGEIKSLQAARPGRFGDRQGRGRRNRARGMLGGRDSAVAASDPLIPGSPGPVRPQVLGRSAALLGRLVHDLLQRAVNPVDHFP